MSTATDLAAPTRVQATTALSKEQTIRGMIESAKPKIMQVLTRGVDPDRFVRLCIFNITRNPSLMKCTPLSLIECVMTAAELGVALGGSLGEAWPVPYGNTATFILGYRGMAKLARRGSDIESIEARVVRDGDFFEFEYGLETKLRHIPKADSDAPITHAYAIVHYKGNSYQFDVMTKSEVDSIRKRSRAGNSGPWVTDYAEMAKKTIFRRLAKWLDLSSEAVEAFERSDRNEFGDLTGEVLPDTTETSGSRTNRLAAKLTNGNGHEAESTDPKGEAEQDGAGASDAESEGQGEADGAAPPLWEQAVIMLAEKHEATHEAAKARIDAYCQSMFRKGVEYVSADNVRRIIEQIKQDQIVIE